MVSTALSLIMAAGVTMAPVPDSDQAPRTPFKPPYSAQVDVSNLCKTQTGVCLLSPPQPVGSACACGSAPGFVIPSQ